MRTLISRLGGSGLASRRNRRGSRASQATSHRHSSRALSSSRRSTPSSPSISARVLRRVWVGARTGSRSTIRKASAPSAKRCAACKCGGALARRLLRRFHDCATGRPAAAPGPIPTSSGRGRDNASARTNSWISSSDGSRPTSPATGSMDPRRWAIESSTHRTRASDAGSATARERAGQPWRSNTSARQRDLGRAAT